MKDLTKQLDRLKEIRPEPSWKENERAVLESRIRSSRISQEADLKERLFSKFIYVVRGLKSRLVRPAWAGIAVLLLVLLGGGAIVQASEDAKPGSLLYYARLAKEKTQIATTFDEREKNKLSLKFAGEHATDIT